MATSSPQRIIAPHPRILDEVVGHNLPQWAVDFVVINLDRDLPVGIHLTLALAKGSASPHVRAMYATAVDFWRRIDVLMSRGDMTSLGQARQLLNFPEPFEFRLGYAGMGSYGAGLGAGALCDLLFDALMRYPELRRTLTLEPDALAFVPWIALDRSADVIATITKLHLIRFTQEQAVFWQFAPSCMESRTVDNCWDPQLSKLKSVTEIVPVDDLGRTFLLVPKEICRSSPPMNASQYFRDVDPDSPFVSGDSGTAKQRLLDDAAANPGRLSEFAKERLRDPSRFKPRREYRRPKHLGQ